MRRGAERAGGGDGGREERGRACKWSGGRGVEGGGVAKVHGRGLFAGKRRLRPPQCAPIARALAARLPERSARNGTCKPDRCGVRPHRPRPPAPRRIARFTSSHHISPDLC